MVNLFDRPTGWFDQELPNIETRKIDKVLHYDVYYGDDNPTTMTCKEFVKRILHRNACHFAPSPKFKGRAKSIFKAEELPFDVKPLG